ncbi:MAG: hypothetical protein H7232_02300 [Aeromicrobium sp.]|nr:hypothetical protein [Burkholderiales bacterium]
MQKLLLEQWWLRWLVQLASFACVPLVALATYYLDQNWEVIGDLRITQQITDAEGVLIYGIFTKQRECTFSEALVVSGDGNVTQIRLPGRPVGAATVSRPLGEQRFGPWQIDVKPGQRATLFARHRCHFAWEHGEMLTTFVVGADR